MTHENIHPASTTSTSTSKSSNIVVGGGITSLLEKYTTLNNAISSTRNEISNLQSTITQTQTQLSSIQSKSKSIQCKTSILQNKQIPTIHQQLQIIQNEYYNVLDSKESMEQKLWMMNEKVEQMKVRKEESRKEFLNSCREFRMSVRRNRICLDSLVREDVDIDDDVRENVDHNTNEDCHDTDLNHSNTHSCNNRKRRSELDQHNHQHFRRSYEGVRIEYPNHNNMQQEQRSYENDEDGFTLATNESTISMVWGEMTSNRSSSHDNLSSTSSASTYPYISTTTTMTTTTTSPNPSKNDHEMKDNLQSLLQSQQLKSQTKSIFTRVKNERQSITNRSNDRCIKLKQQRDQLEKIRLDAQELERDIALLEENTLECRQISEGYAQGK